MWNLRADIGVDLVENRGAADDSRSVRRRRSVRPFTRPPVRQEPSMTVPVPFRLAVPEAELADLRDRLVRTRLPETPPGEPWLTGTDPAFMREVIAHWRERFDWRAQEARLNAFPQFRVRLAGIDLHYLHVPGVRAPGAPEPLPLLLSHGWPGSVFEFLELIPRLVDPARFGGDPADAFTVVAPSLPGYGLSFAPGQPRFAVEDIARTFHTLMTGVLGIRRFGAQGGDWGSFVTSLLGAEFPESVAGIHLNMMPVRRDASALASPTPEERRWLDELALFLKEETGYQWIQGTRPQTLAFGLTDSPAGLAAWILEKFQRWTDCGGDPRNAVPLDTMLANISLYWFTGAIGSSFWPYYARMHSPWPIRDGSIDVPAGYVQFPREILRPPRSIAARVYTDLRRWTVAPRGGHFAALEQPDVLLEEIRAFFRPLRG
jgi:microsomal epoxide hydrolase